MEMLIVQLIDLQCSILPSRSLIKGKMRYVSPFGQNQSKWEPEFIRAAEAQPYDVSNEYVFLSGCGRIIHSSIEFGREY